MKNLFIEILNMSITAGIVACVVILIRLPLKKSPKIFSYALWAVVLFRLLSPFTFESAFSLMPASPNTVLPDIVYIQSPAIQSNIVPIDNTVNTAISQALPPADPVNGVNPIDVLLEMGAYVWMLGIAVLLGYVLYSCIRLKAHLKTATLVWDNIYETDRITTPFVFGFVRPRIYMPAGIEDIDYILKHEQTHIRRKDHLIKPVAFFALCLHWFNPVIWLSYILMCKDMEMSCDESVLRRAGEDIRAVYSESLLSLSVKRSGLLSPLAFGESNTKMRIKNVLGYKKPAFWISVTAVIVVLSVTVGFAANRVLLVEDDIKNETITDTAEIAIEQEVSLPSENELLAPAQSGHYVDSTQLITNAPAGQYSEGVEVIVTLRNGNMLTKVYDEHCRDPYLFHTDLLGDGVDELVLCIPNPTSNYGASDIHVLKVVGDDLIEILTILDGDEESDKVEKYWQTLFKVPQSEDNSGFLMELGNFSRFCTGVSIVSVDGRQGLKIRHLMREFTLCTVLTWSGLEWTVVGQGVDNNFDIPFTKDIPIVREGEEEVLTANLKISRMGYAIYLFEDYVLTDTNYGDFIHPSEDSSILKSINMLIAHSDRMYQLPEETVKDGLVTKYRRIISGDYTFDVTISYPAEASEGGAVLLYAMLDTFTWSSNAAEEVNEEQYQTEAAFLNSAEGTALQSVAYGAAKALLSADADELANYMFDPNETSHTVRNLTNIFDEVESMTLVWSLDDIKSDDEINVSYRYWLKGEDSVSYVTMELIRADDAWKVRWLGIEK